MVSYIDIRISLSKKNLKSFTFGDYEQISKLNIGVASQAQDFMKDGVHGQCCLHFYVHTPGK